MYKGLVFFLIFMGIIDKLLMGVRHEIKSPQSGAQG